MHRFFKLFKINRAGKEHWVNTQDEPAVQLVRKSGDDKSLFGGGQAALKAPAQFAWGPQDLPSDGVLRLNEVGKILDLNGRALELLHNSPLAKAGLDFWEAVPIEIAEQHQNVAANALMISTQHSFVAHPSFEGGWIRYTFRKTTFGYIVNLRDVASTQKLLHALDENQRYNQLIFEANPNPMWIFDSVSLRVIAVNRSAVEFYGIPRSKFMAINMNALFPEEEGAAFLLSLYPDKNRGDTQLDLRLCKQKKSNGQLALVELGCAHVSWRGQRAVFVSLADTSERHLADSELRRINTELEEALFSREKELKDANRDLSAFAYALSHDLQGPLHAANGFATMLADKYSSALDESGRHYVRRIQAGTRQLAKYLDDLRLLVQLPQQVEPWDLVDLTPLCQSLFKDLRKRDPARLAVIELEVSMPLMCDKRLLTTALACLLDNAWKFTSKKPEAWITVGLMSGESAGEIVMWVADNGAGFDTVYRDKLFTPFQRLHSSADFPGNGLGLAIVKRVAERHAGKVWAETSGDAGAKFFMSFPQGAVASA